MNSLLVGTARPPESDEIQIQGRRLEGSKGRIQKVHWEKRPENTLKLPENTLNQDFQCIQKAHREKHPENTLILPENTLKLPENTLKTL